jgi:hypothetical protein
MMLPAVRGVVETSWTDDPRRGRALHPTDDVATYGFRAMRSAAIAAGPIGGHDPLLFAFTVVSTTGGAAMLR